MTEEDRQADVDSIPQMCGFRRLYCSFVFASICTWRVFCSLTQVLKCVKLTPNTFPYFQQNKVSVSSHTSVCEESSLPALCLFRLKEAKRGQALGRERFPLSREKCPRCFAVFGVYHRNQTVLMTHDPRDGGGPRGLVSIRLASDPPTSHCPSLLPFTLTQRSEANEPKVPTCLAPNVLGNAMTENFYVFLRCSLILFSRS